MDIFFLAGTVVLTASSSMLIKKSKNIAGSGSTESIFFTLFIAVYSIIIFILINRFKITLYPLNFVFACAYAVLGIFSNVLMIKAFSCGKVSTYLIMTNTGAVLFPYIVGIIWLDEAFSFIKTFGIVLMCVAFVIKNTGTDPSAQPAEKISDVNGEQEADEKKPKANKLFLFLCLAGACISGFANVVISLNSTLVPLSDNVSFSIMTQTFVLGLTIAFLLIRFNKTKQTLMTNRKMTGLANLGVALAYSAIAGGGLIFSLESAKRLPSSVVFPISSSGNIVLVTIFDTLFYKEKFTLRDLIATVLIVVAIVLVSLGGA